MIINWALEQGYVGLNPLIRGWGSSAAPAAVVIPSARGNIDYDQVRVAARTGNGDKLMTWQTPYPAVATSTGTPGMTAYDSAGNFYWCYAADQWARIGPGGYSTTF